jgi:hypothetical protein
MALTGSCLCGAVKYQSAADPLFAGNCYCIDCQKETGAGHGTIVGVPDAAFSVTGPLTTFTKPGDSGKNLERSFCSKCGTTVFGRPEAAPGLTLIRAGTLDDPSIATPIMSLYVSRAHNWDPPVAGVPGHPEMLPS